MARAATTQQRSRAGGGTSRRAASKGDLREQAILDTATALLRKKPFADISVEEIAAGAGISRSSFYFYFCSKEALLRALDERIGRAALERHQGDLELPDAVRRSIEYAVRGWREQGPIYKAIISQMASDRLLAEQWDGQVTEMVARAAERIKRERRRGKALPAPPSARALASALTTLNEQCMMAVTSGRPFAINDGEIVQTLTAIWLRAIYGTDQPG